MIRYEVVLDCPAATAPALERWMRTIHIPEMLATGCFVGIHFDRAGGRFRTVYQAATRQHLDRYLAEHATTMRASFQQRFPDRVTVSRETWEQVQDWTAG